MRNCYLITVLLLTMLPAWGCRRDPYTDAYFDMLNAEKRALEDRIYELEYNYKEALDELKKYREADEEPSERRPTRAEPEGESGEPDVGDDYQIEIPVPEYPPGFEGPSVQDSASVDQHPVVIPAAASIASEALSPRSESAGEVDSIRLVAGKTGGRDFDGLPGVDGISMVIQPLDRNQNVVPAAGEIDVALLDPTQPCEAARFARWDISAEMAEASFGGSGRDAGITLRLPWPEDVPEAGRLHLFVRLNTADGRRLVTDQWIDLPLSGRIAQHWTPRPGDAQPDGYAEVPASFAEALESSSACEAPAWSPDR